MTVGTAVEWVRLLGGAADAEPLRAEISVEANGQRHESRNCRVVAIDASNADVVEEDDCFELSARQVRRCMEDPAVNGECESLNNAATPPGFAGIITVQYRVKRQYLTYSQLIDGIGI